MSKSQQFFRIFTALFIYHLLIFYVGYNIYVWIHHAFNFQSPLIFLLILLFMAYSYPLARFKNIPLLKVLGAYWVGFLQYAIILFPLANITFLISLLLPLSNSAVIKAIGTVVFVIFIGIFSYGIRQAYHTIIRRHEITIPKQTKRKNLRIAVASDMHFGTLSGIRHVKRLVLHMQEIKPDLILLVGDVIDDDPHVFIQKKMGDEMAHIVAPLGIYGVLGNHEYYGGEIPSYLKEMERINIAILQDEWVNIEDDFILIGRKDKTDRARSSIKTLTENINSVRTIIMMDHQPFDLKEACIHGVDLLLCGHTHRGQMAPNHFITKRMYELDWGYKQQEQLHTFVSSGFGFWGPPIRIGSRSEILQIDITFA